MILNVSGRTDIIAFYSEWFITRYKEGYVDVRNPFNKNLVSRIYFEDVDAILFCTKNPTPILKFLKEIKQPILFHVTLTPYKKDIEPNVPDKREIIDSIKKVSKLVGIENLFIRYDPIFLSPKYNVNYHIKAFDKLCYLLDGYVKNWIVSFMDDYKNVRKNKKILQYRELQEDFKEIGKHFSASAKNHNMRVQTCFEDRTLVEYGFQKGECLSHELAFRLTGKTYKSWTARKGKKCNCVEMVDIGDYNSCHHLCKYCYANFDEEKVENNIKKHDKNSTLLIGTVEKGDTVKVRKK